MVISEKKLFLYSNILLVIVWVFEREVLEKYNAVVEKVGEVQLTNDINLQGKRDYGEDHYTGTYQQSTKNFLIQNIFFGGTTIERAAGKQVELFCDLEIIKGEAEIFIISGSNEPKTLIKTTGTYENTITLPMAVIISGL